MTNFIEEFYYGNIDPQNSGFEEDESVQRDMQTIRENDDYLSDTLSGEEKERLKAVYQAILDQFQDLLKKNIPPDDPRISELIKRLLDETFSLTPPHQQEKLKKNYHILMKQYLEELLNQTPDISSVN